MLSWVLMSVIGGRILLKVGFRSITIVGFIVLTVGFVFLALFQRETPRFWLYFDLVLIGAGLGLTMLTLLIAVQQAVDRSKLGVVTSLNQFSRAIGGAFGVAIMGAFLTAGLATHLNNAAKSGNAHITIEQAAAFAENPNALIDPQEKSALTPETLDILQQAMASSIHRVFWIGAVLSALALLVAFLLPKKDDSSLHKTDENVGEKMFMAEQTTINARNQLSSQG
jgi:MFS family permease